MPPTHSMERELDWVAGWAGLTSSSLVGTAISLTTSLPKLETGTMRLSFSVEKTVEDEAKSSVITLFPDMSNLEL